MKTKTPLHRIAALFALALLATFGATHEAKAQTNAFTNATYTFGTNGNTNSFAYNGSNVANLTEGNMVKSAGITSTGSSGNFRGDNWTTGSSLDANDYIGVTLTADSGWTLNMTNMTFGIGRSATGTRAWAWYYSTNSFSSSIILTNYTTLATGLTNTAGVLSHADANSSWTGNVLNLSSLTNLGTVEFRLYSWLSEASGGTAGLQGPLSFSGAMVASAVAAPGNFWAGVAGGGGSGIWTSTSTNWATGADGAGRGGTQATSGALVFTNTAGTVDVGDPVTVNAGMQFATDGYTVRSNTITLAGANAAANTITTDTGVGTTINSVLAGSAGMTKEGSGTLTLGGANTYSGGTLISGGRLVGNTASLQGTITNNAAVTFNQSANGTYSSAMSGTGGMTKSGAGTLTMSGVNTFSGATTISAGELVVNGTNASSAVTVSSSTTLSGSGEVGGLTVSGLLSPGNSIGTLSAGNTTFAADGAFRLEMFDWTSSAGTGWDLLAITGDLTISSTSLNPFTIDLVSFSDATTPGFSVNFNANQSFTNTFVTYTGSLIGFGSDLFVVDASSFLNATNGTFSITNVSNGLALLYTTAFNPGASYDWNAGSGNWSVAGNWAGDAAPTNNSLLLFTGAAGTATNNAAVTSVTGVIFSNTSGSIALAGDAFALGEGGIENDSANAHTISNNMSLAASASILAVSNNLTIAGNITNDTASRLLTVGGSENTTISGAVSGQGDLSKIGLGTLTLSGANTFTGSFGISGGEAIVSGTAATTSIAVNSGGTLSLGATEALANGATVTVDMGTFNTATFNDTIGTLVLTNGGTVSGTGVLGATTFTLGGGTVSGALGAGTANVTGEVSLTGTMASTTINVNSGGTLTLGSADRIGGSTAVVIAGGTLAMGANNDTVGTFFITSGTLGGNGTLTASTYALGGGTISANLGTGAATAATGTTTVDGNLGGTLTASGGTVNLNGTLADDLTVSGGTVNVGSADRLADTSDVSISSGTLGLGANDDTVGTFAITGGTLGGTGTLTAATYALNGGTIGANIGAGAATASSGSTTLNGSLDATTFSISGGTVVLGSPGRIGNDTAVTLSSGQLDTVTFTDSVGSFVMTGGTLAGTGQINSATYDLQAGTINANLGTGTATVSTGTTDLNGNLGGNLTASSGTANVGGTIAGNVTVSGGTVNVGSADRIGNTSAASVSSGTLDFAGNDTVGAVQLTGGTITGAGIVTGASYDVQSGTISAALAGTGAMTKTGAGTTTLSANNSGYSGAVAVNDGSILASTSGALGTGAVAMSSGSTLAANGVTLANDFTIGTAGGTITNFGSTTVLAGWDFNGVTGGGTNDMKAGTLASGVVNGTGLTRGPGVVVPGSAASRAWGGESWNTADQAAAITAGDFFTFTLAADPNTVLRFASLDPFDYRRSGTGATLGALQYSTDGLSFTDITTSISYTSSSSSGSTIAAIDLSAIADLSTGTTLTFRIANWGATASGGTWYLFDTGTDAGTDDFAIRGQVGTVSSGIASGSGTLGIEEAGTATFSGNVVNNTEATFTAASGGLATFSGTVSGEGTLSKTGAGTVTLSGASANTFTGMTTVSAGTLQLDKTAGTDAIAGDVTANSGAVLLISASNQVNDSSAVSLSGGTITRGTGVSEVFGNLNLTEASFLDFGTGTAGTLSFGEYVPSALLTINNFGLGNTLTFGSDLSGSINNAALFSFDNGFNSSWNSGTSTFTITAIPEPSTYLAAAGLLSLMLWPSRKRLLKDTKKILGLTLPMRDRLAVRRAQKTRLEA